MPAQTVSQSPDRTATRNGRFGLVDGVRFVAAMAVVVFHFTARDNEAWGEPVASIFPGLGRLTSWGAYGVDLFFIISGFVILMTAWRKDVPHFIGSRFARLFPAYWFGVLATGVLLLWIREEPTSLSLMDVGLNLTMLQSAFGVEHVDGVYWTLWTELRFYVLIGIFIAVGLTRQRVVLFAAAWAPVASLSARQDADLLRTLLISDYAPLFAGGMMIFLLSQNPRSLIVWVVLVENILIASAISVDHTGQIISSDAQVQVSGIGGAIATVACFAVVMIAVLTRARHVSWTWLAKLGLLTYPLYLIHEHWGWWMISLFPSTAPRLVVLATVVLLCVAAAACINRVIEKPLARPLRRGMESSIRALAVRDSSHGAPDEDCNPPRGYPTDNVARAGRGPNVTSSQRIVEAPAP